MDSLRSMLAAGGHRMALGRVCEVARLVLARPSLSRQLVECLCDSDPGIANRAADALERASYYQPAILARWKDLLLALLAEATENKLRWNLALIVPRLDLSPSECERAAAVLNTYLSDRSSIVKTAAMQGLAGMARQNAALLPGIVDLLRILARSGTPAMRARGRILLKKFETAAPGSEIARQRATQRSRPYDAARDPRFLKRNIAME